MFIAGKNFPEVEDHSLFVDHGFGKFWVLNPDGDKAVGTRHVRQIAVAPTVVAFTSDPRNGEILSSSLDRKILRLDRTAGAK